MIITIDSEKNSLKKIQHALLINVSENEWLGASYLNIVKPTCRKLTVKVILNEEKLKAIPLKSGMRHSYPLSPFPFNIVLDVLAGIVRQEKKIKDIQMGKEV